MAVVTFKPEEGRAFESVNLKDGESVLDALLRDGFDVPFGCKSGVCQSCLLQVKEGELPHASQLGLKPSQVDQGLFLSCSCAPSSDLVITKADLTGELTEAKVIELFPLNNDIFCLRLEKTIDYKPGQFLTLWNASGVARSYSIASHPEHDAYIEFHIKRIEGGAFSDWAFNHLNVGDVLKVQGPMGSCYYSIEDPQQSLFLSGIGTGLAPLYGILLDALHQGHKGNITLLVGAKEDSSFYFIDQLKTLERQYSNLEIIFVAQVLDSDASGLNGRQSDIYEYAKSSIGDFKNVAIFLCGAESFVRKMKKICFLHGAAMREISSDPFIPFHS